DVLSQQMLDDGMRMREQGDLDASEELLTRLVEYCPDYAEGFNQRAFTRYIAQDFEGAVPDLERTLELRPRHLGALSGKALTHSALNDLASAIPLLREMVRLNPWARERAMLESLGTDL
ncbi:MAG: tetratricopeptide repeat protein, partial [Planktomarina sp.]